MRQLSTYTLARPKMSRPGECPPRALDLARHVLSRSPLRLLKFPRLRHLPQDGYSDEEQDKEVRAHSCARRPDRAVGMVPLNTNTPATHPTFVDACFSLQICG